MTRKQREQQEAITSLRSIIQPGETVYTKHLHTSRSGMYRVVDVYIMRDNEPRRISRAVATAIGSRYDERHEGVAVGGCGFDVGHSVVYGLGHYLFRDGYMCVGKGCPSNDHSNGDRDYTPHMHTSGGYALHHSWM